MPKKALHVIPAQSRKHPNLAVLDFAHRVLGSVAVGGQRVISAVPALKGSQSLPFHARVSPRLLDMDFIADRVQIPDFAYRAFLEVL